MISAVCRTGAQSAQLAISRVQKSAQASEDACAPVKARSPLRYARTHSKAQVLPGAGGHLTRNVRCARKDSLRRPRDRRLKIICEIVDINQQRLSAQGTIQVQVTERRFFGHER